MQKVLLFCFLFHSFNYGISQDLTNIAKLEEVIAESSGILILEDRVFIHNDSDQGPFIYEYNLELKKIIRSIKVLGAENIDWEDIGSDSLNVYIGDFGNNLGNRKDLGIYKVLKTDLLNPENIEIESELIEFNFKDQTSFNESPYSSNFDAEALICWGNYIYVFSKNWDDFKTKLYRIPKTRGKYEVEPLVTFNIEGLVAGAAINNKTSQIVLTGYDEESAFVILFKDCDENFKKCDFQKYYLELDKGVSFQVEGIDFIDDKNLLLSSESGVFGEGYILKLNLDFQN